MTSDCENMIDDLKEKLDNEFKIKNLRSLKYFFGIEINRSWNGIYIC